MVNVRVIRRLGEWVVVWGVRNFIYIFFFFLYFDYYYYRDIKEDFRFYRFVNEFVRSKVVSEEVINMFS